MPRRAPWLFAIAAIFATLIIGVSSAGAARLHYCGSFPFKGEKIGVNSERVRCHTARKVARRKLHHRPTLGFVCKKGPKQGSVRTYKCRKGRKRVYIYNAGYESEKLTPESQSGEASKLAKSSYWRHCGDGYPHYNYFKPQSPQPRLPLRQAHC